MIKYIMAFCALVIVVGTGGVSWAAEDNITCALTRAYACDPDEGCTPSSIDDMALPRFVRIDLDGKSITSLDKAIQRTSNIDHVDRLEGMTVMHGTELRGWSIALGKDSGDITLSASGDGEAFVVFGNCLQ